MTSLALREQAQDPKSKPSLLRELADSDVTLARLVVGNPSASAQLLEDLSKSKDLQTRKIITSHAGTPARVLRVLGGMFPEQLLENPIFDFLLLEDPAFFEGMNVSRLANFVKKNTCSIEIIKHASKIKEESVQLALLMNQSTPKKVVDRIIKHAVTSKVVDLAKRHVNFTHGQTVTLLDAERIYWKEIYQRFYTAQYIDFDLLERSIISGDKRQNILYTLAGRIDHIGSLVRKYFAISPETDPVILACLAVDPEKDTKSIVFENPVCPEEIKQLQNRAIKNSRQWDKYINEYTIRIDENLHEWVKSDYALFHYLVVHYPKTPADVLIRLIEIKPLSLALLGQVAHKKTTNSEQLGLMLTKSIPLKECAKKRQLFNKIASHQNTDASDLIRLIQNGNHRARVLVARRDDLTQDVLEMLSVDESVEVRVLVANNSKSNKDLVKKILHVFVEKYTTTTNTSVWSSDFTAINCVVEHPLTSSNVLRKLAKREKEPYILQDIAKHRNTTKELSTKLLLDLSVSDNQFHREFAASCELTPMSILMELANDENTGVREGVIKNISIPDKLRKKLIEELDATGQNDFVACYKKTSEELLRLYADVGGEGLKKNVASSSNVPVDVLQKLSSDQSTDVRKAVAGHVNTPIDTLNKLANDVSGEVRTAVVCKVINREASSGFYKYIWRKNELSTGDLEQMIAVEHEYADTSNFLVKTYITMHKNCSNRLKKRLVENGDTDALVLNYECAYEGAQSPNTPQELLILIAVHGARIIRKYASQNKKMPTGKVAVELLCSLSKSNKTWVRSRVAMHPLTPVNILKKLMSDHETEVKLSVVINPSLQGQTILRLIMQYEIELKAFRDYYAFQEFDLDPIDIGLVNIASNRKSSSSVIKKAFECAMNQTEAGDIEELSSLFMHALAKNANTPKTILKKVCDNWDWYKNDMLEHNPSTDLSVWERLTKSA